VQNRSSFCFYAIPGKSALRFAWENRFALFLALLYPADAQESGGLLTAY
jgi:hypothetical protein